MATLVLTREGHNVVFYNYGAREVWKPRFVKSRRYGADVLTFFVEKKNVWNKVPDNNLTVEISNITKEQYAEIVKTNLHLQDVGETYLTDKGRILLEDRYKGKVYVNGLYVCDYEDYRYGYDFNPSELELDRDRKLVSDFDLKYLSSKMWNKQDEELTDLIVEMLEQGVADVRYVSIAVDYSDEWLEKKENLSKVAVQKFKAKHGENAVPVTSQEEMDSVAEGYKAVIVKSGYKSVLEDSIEMETEKVYKKTTYQKLMEWFTEVEDRLTEEEKDRFKTIVETDLN